MQLISSAVTGLGGPQRASAAPACASSRDTVLCFFARSCLTLCDPWAAAHQAPLSMGFFRQEYWSRWPCPPPGELPNSGGPVVKNLPSKAEDTGLNPGQESKVPHFVGPVSLHEN